LTPWLILFDSVHHVLAAEVVFQERALWYDLIPAPRDLRPDCGIALAFRGEDCDAVGRVLTDRRVMGGRLYRPAAGGYEAVPF